MFEERIEKAVEFFKSGYNCSQSLLPAFSVFFFRHDDKRKKEWGNKNLQTLPYPFFSLLYPTTWDNDQNVQHHSEYAPLSVTGEQVRSPYNNQYAILYSLRGS